MKKRLSFIVLFLCAHLNAQPTKPATSLTSASQTNSVVTEVKDGAVVISGSVPSQEIKRIIENRLKNIYPSAKIINQLQVEGVSTPINWSEKIEKVLQASLSKVSKGELRVEGNIVKIRGQVANANDKAEVLQLLTSTFGADFTVQENLIVLGTEQNLLDNALQNRIIEFDSGSAVISDSGKKILDEMVEPIFKLKDRKIDIVGHTDNRGSPERNLNLSKERAEAVKMYLLTKGIPVNTLNTHGMGSNQPIVSNDTEQGRKQNRRIEFKLVK